MTCSRNGSGTFLGVNRQKSFASGCSLIVYSPLRPENNLGYFSGILWVMVFMPVMTSSALMAGKPSKMFINCDWLWDSQPLMHKDKYSEICNSVIQYVISQEGLKLQACNLV